MQGCDCLTKVSYPVDGTHVNVYIVQANQDVVHAQYDPKAYLYTFSIVHNDNCYMVEYAQGPTCHLQHADYNLP